MAAMDKLQCRWCGLVGEPDDFDLDEKYHNGFWCPDCDGFTAYEENDNRRHRMLLLLEHGGAATEPAIPFQKEVEDASFRKRLSPLRYPGGKSKVIDYIYSRLQYDKLDTFVEVFAGGASLGLSLLDAGVVQDLYLNDFDPFVSAFWRTALHNSNYLQKRVLEQLPTISDFDNAKAVLADPERYCEEEKAWAFFLLNRTCFSGIVSANRLGGQAGTQEQMLARWNQTGLLLRLKRVAEMAPNIHFSNMDCCDFLEDVVYWLPRATLFLDPPYVKRGAVLYQSAFTNEDHERLSFSLNQLYVSMPGPDVILTYDDCQLIRELYPLADCETLPRCYSCARLA